MSLQPGQGCRCSIFQALGVQSSQLGRVFKWELLSCGGGSQGPLLRMDLRLWCREEGSGVWITSGPLTFATYQQQASMSACCRRLGVFN